MPKWNAADYEKNSSAQQRWAFELIYGLNLKGDEYILDIGCGDGKVTAELAAQIPLGRVVGIDNSTEMVNFARKKYPPLDFSNLFFEYGDASDLRYRDRFDLIVSFSCLHWVIDHTPVIQGIKRSLKPSGKVLLQFGGKGNAAAILKAAEKIMDGDKWRSYFTNFIFPWGFYGPEEYRFWLEKNGLVAKRVELVVKDMTYSDKNGLKAWFRTTWLPYLEKIPERMRTEFVDEVIDSYTIGCPPDNSGVIHVPMVRLEVEAEKV